MYYFQRACIQSLFDFEPCECSETVDFIFQNMVLERLLRVAEAQGCISLNTILAAEESWVNSVLRDLAMKFPDDWKEYDLPECKAESSKLSGILYLEHEICFFGADGSVEVFRLGDSALEKLDHAENEIAMREPAISFDLYGNIWGYSRAGAVVLIEGDSGW